MKLITATALLCASEIATGLAFARSGDCCIITDKRTAELTVKVKYHVVIVSGTITSAPAGGVTGALVFDTCRNESFAPCGSICPDLALDADSDADSGDLKTHHLLAGASAFSLVFDEVYGQGGIDWTLLDGTSTVSQGSGSLSYAFEDTSPLPCTSNGYEDLGSLGWAVASASGTWNFTGSIVFTASVNLEGSSSSVFLDGCEDPCGNGKPVPNPPPFDYVTFFSVTRTQGATSRIDQGVFATFEDGSTTRLGYYTNSAFDPTPTGDGFTVSSGDVNLPSMGGSGGAYVLDVRQDHFAGFTGDLDANQMTCWDDRDDFMSRLGASINSVNYTARADFDLDGDIDDTDLALFNAIGCTADVDCNGTLDLFDYTGFQNKYNAHDLSADMNHDSAWDTFDYLQFQNTFNSGCP